MTKRLRYLFRRRSLRGFPDAELLSVYRDYGVIPKSSRDDNYNRASEDLSNYQLVRRGDLVVNKMKAWQGSVAISEFDGIVSPAYFVFDATNDEHPRFLHYLLRSQPFIEKYGAASKGIRPSQWDLDMNLFKDIAVALPDVDDQVRIATFLDRETAKADALVGKYERLIELVEEKRATLITQAITKGLDLTVPMKDSGVGWIGDLPEHWQLIKLRFLCDIGTGGRDTEDATETGEYPFFVRSQEVERINDYAFDCEAVLTAGDGAGVGKVYHYYNGKFNAHQRVYVLSRFRRVLGRYMFHYLKSNFARVVLQGTAKSTVESLRMPMLKDFVVCVPELDEQQRVVEYCDNLGEKSERLIGTVQKALSLVKEHRAALITAAVIGQIDVRTYKSKDIEVPA